jgi:hypothetical protein
MRYNRLCSSSSSNSINREQEGASARSLLCLEAYCVVTSVVQQKS